MFDSSDEATGLPPLDQINLDNAMFPIAWQVGPRGTVFTDDPDDAPAQEGISVRYLSVRGVLPVPGEDAHVTTQFHIAFPEEGLRSLLETWILILDQDDDESPASPE